VYNGKSILAVIPARSGSKGLPDKNIRPLLGRPLIAWTIEQGQSSKYIDRLVVSTDSNRIADISREFRAEVPFLRPNVLAQDDSTSMDVMLHAIEWMEKAGNSFDIVIMLEPTSPLRDVCDIDAAIELLVDHESAESVVGLGCVSSVHPDFLVRMRDGFLCPYSNLDYKVRRRQDIESLYFFEGSLYISYIDSLKIKKNFYHEKTLGYIMPKWKTYEVDDISDFIIIESLLQAKLAGNLLNESVGEVCVK